METADSLAISLTVVRNASITGRRNMGEMIGNTDAVCPNCSKLLDKIPGRKSKCPHCAEYIYVRTRPVDLLCNCQVCARIVRGDPTNIADYEDQEELAELHFLINRAQEKDFIGRRTLTEIA